VPAQTVPDVVDHSVSTRSAVSAARDAFNVHRPHEALLVTGRETSGHR